MEEHNNKDTKNMEKEMVNTTKPMCLRFAGKTLCQGEKIIVEDTRGSAIIGYFCGYYSGFISISSTKECSIITEVISFKRIKRIIFLGDRE